MSKVSISGNASGTGVFTIQAPNSNVDRVLSLPDEAGTVLTSASNVAQNSGDVVLVRKTAGYTTLNHSTSLLIPFGVKDIDLNSSFDDTNYRFQPTQAGWYFINTEVTFAINLSRNYNGQVQIYKNGARYTNNGHNWQSGGITPDRTIVVSSVMYLNGSTDYASIYAYQYDYTANSSITIYGDYQLTTANFSLIRKA